MIITPEQLRDRLTARVRTRSEARGRSAAVLVPLFEHDGDVKVLFIKRTETVRTHKGQYALPGGSREPDDVDLVHTALREAEEEVGIAPRDVRVLGALDDLVTVTGFVITPVVGWLPHPYAWKPDPREVAYTVELPLASFVEPPRARSLLGEGFRRIVLAFDVEGHFVWGATASILRMLATVVRSE